MQEKEVAKKQIWLEIKEQFLCFMFEIKIYNTFISYQKLWPRDDKEELNQLSGEHFRLSIM